MKMKEKLAEKARMLGTILIIFIIIQIASSQKRKLLRGNRKLLNLFFRIKMISRTYLIRDFKICHLKWIKRHSLRIDNRKYMSESMDSNSHSSITSLSFLAQQSLMKNQRMETQKRAKSLLRSVAIHASAAKTC